MNNFNFYVLGNHSPNIRMFGKYKCTCYMLNGFSKNIFLDFGAGIFLKFLRLIKREKIDINNIMIIISHNHLDHNLSLMLFAIYLWVYNLFHRKNKKVNVILPNNNFMYKFVKLFKNEYEVSILTKDIKFDMDGCKFSFCETIHKGGSYATKIESKNGVFIYVSDLAKVSKPLSSFVKNANVVMVDSGYPFKKLDSFLDYHGMTQDIMYDLYECNIKKILATHLRICYKKENYIQKFPEKANVKLVRENSTYNLFK